MTFSHNPIQRNTNLILTCSGMAVSRHQLFVVHIKPYDSIRAENCVYSKKKCNSLHSSLKPELWVFKAVSADDELGMILCFLVWQSVQGKYITVCSKQKVSEVWNCPGGRAAARNIIAYSLPPDLISGHCTFRNDKIFATLTFGDVISYEIVNHGLKKKKHYRPLRFGSRKLLLETLEAKVITHSPDV